MEIILEWKRDILLLLTLGCCNSLPIAASLCFKERFSLPVDFGALWFDKRPLFGPHKTWRGVISSILGTAAVCSLFPFPGAWMGAKIAALSMAGDLISSFVKRRSGLRPGHSVIGLDQCVEAFLPLWGIKGGLNLGWFDILLIVLVFFSLELIISPVLYRFHIRHDPY